MDLTPEEIRQISASRRASKRRPQVYLDQTRRRIRKTPEHKVQPSEQFPRQSIDPQIERELRTTDYVSTKNEIKFPFVNDPSKENREWAESTRIDNQSTRLNEDRRNVCVQKAIYQQAPRAISGSDTSSMINRRYYENLLQDPAVIYDLPVAVDTALNQNHPKRHYIMDKDVTRKVRRQLVELKRMREEMNTVRPVHIEVSRYRHSDEVIILPERSFSTSEPRVAIGAVSLKDNGLKPPEKTQECGSLNGSKFKSIQSPEFRSIKFDRSKKKLINQTEVPKVSLKPELSEKPQRRKILLDSGYEPKGSSESRLWENTAPTSESKQESINQTETSKVSIKSEKTHRRKILMDSESEPKGSSESRLSENTGESKHEINNQTEMSKVSIKPEKTHRRKILMDSESEPKGSSKSRLSENTGESRHEIINQTEMSKVSKKPELDEKIQKSKIFRDKYPETRGPSEIGFTRNISPTKVPRSNSELIDQAETSQVSLTPEESEKIQKFDNEPESRKSFELRLKENNVRSKIGLSNMGYNMDTGSEHRKSSIIYDYKKPNTSSDSAGTRVSFVRNSIELSEIAVDSSPASIERKRSARISDLNQTFVKTKRSSILEPELTPSQTKYIPPLSPLESSSLLKLTELLQLDLNELLTTWPDHSIGESQNAFQHKKCALIQLVRLQISRGCEFTPQSRHNLVIVEEPITIDKIGKITESDSSDKTKGLLHTCKLWIAPLLRPLHFLRPNRMLQIMFLCVFVWILISYCMAFGAIRCSRLGDHLMNTHWLLPFPSFCRNKEYREVHYY